MNQLYRTSATWRTRALGASLVASSLLSACWAELAGTGPSVSLADTDASAPPPGDTNPGAVGEDASAPADPGSDVGSDHGPDQPSAEAGGPGASEPDAAAPAPGCRLDGRFAVRIDFDVSWVGTEFVSVVPVLDAGEGTLSYSVLMEGRSVEGGLEGAIRTCEARVPEFVASISRERYQARIQTAVWDSAAMPMFAIHMKTQCSDPGCSLTADPIYALIGAALPMPNAPWPKSPSGGQWPDHDADGKPGIAAVMLGPSEGPYEYPPLDLLSTRRVRDMQLGLRMMVGLSGVVDSCDALHGTTPKGSLEIRAMGCQASTRPFGCSSNELNFLNDNLPVWTVRQGRFQARRVSPTADCEEARRVLTLSAP